MNREARLRSGTRAILLIGFAAAIGIYLMAQPPPENPFGDPLSTKKFVHDLEAYGGKANVVFAEFLEWFDSLWHGKQLAYTVAAITVLAAATFRFVVRRMPSQPEAKPALRLIRGETRGNGDS
jgi:hypothetical protein